MGYILVEIIACLLIAWLLGALLGWWLRGGCKNDNNNVDIDAIKKSYEDEIHNKQDFYNSKVKSIEDTYINKLNIANNEIETLKKELNSLKENKQKLFETNENTDRVQNAPIVNQKDKEKCYELEEIEGIGPGFALRLKKRGVLNSCYLANKFLYDEHETKKLAKKLEINADTITAWASMADLMKIEGINSEYAEILQEVGIKTRYELSKEDPDKLYEKIENYKKKYPNGPDIPDLNDIHSWIEKIS